ncbi:YhcN/YlaJ family sporulation lipoprotein [Sporosarcina luteola]|uniref:YhcN/YlaJ family sporulation lipoprotein n=1 Tax=Sporosarcina luteola TaxID=582850 RepID=UPI002040BE28|nr:YhcN/YlaJ family sporulation lipoprotein [Sporosarcina luteola]MCM3709840.1 YhcN/YlaJ family sporulation lipoprotein [Sporosarcina luteola]
MKKLAISLSLLLMLAIVGCANNKDNNNTNGNATNGNNNAAENTGVGESAQGNNDNTTTTNNGQSKVEVADDAAEKITAMEEVSAANVLVTDQNAYVGVALKEGVKENEDLKKRVADEVRRVHANFNNVYVSFNPDVAKRFTEYGNQIRAGEPAEGFFEEFTTSINRMFPEAK